MNKSIIILVLISSLVLAGCERPIGGERDEHGCLGPAGYTWDADVGACVREWELDEDQKQAAKIAVEHAGHEKGMTILRVDMARCTGCFAVQLEKGGERINITLEDWNVPEALPPEGDITNFEECAAAGYPVVESYPRQCRADDVTFVEGVCKDLCGDGVCQEIVCMAIGCPCAETKESCPEDCRK